MFQSTHTNFVKLLILTCSLTFSRPEDMLLAKNMDGKRVEVLG